jgi:hypothetical protein
MLVEMRVAQLGNHLVVQMEIGKVVTLALMMVDVKAAMKVLQ